MAQYMIAQDKEDDFRSDPVQVGFRRSKSRRWNEDFPGPSSRLIKGYWQRGLYIREKKVKKVKGGTKGRVFDREIPWHNKVEIPLKSRVVH